MRPQRPGPSTSTENTSEGPSRLQSSLQNEPKGLRLSSSLCLVLLLSFSQASLPRAKRNQYCLLANLLRVCLKKLNLRQPHPQLDPLPKDVGGVPFVADVCVQDEFAKEHINIIVASNKNKSRAESSFKNCFKVIGYIKHSFLKKPFIFFCLL